MVEIWKVRGNERRAKMRELIQLIYGEALTHALEKFDEVSDEWDWEHDDGDEWSSSPENILEYLEDEIMLKQFDDGSSTGFLWRALNETEHVPDEDEVDAIILFMVENKCDSLNDVKKLSKRLEA